MSGSSQRNTRRRAELERRRQRARHAAAMQRRRRRRRIMVWSVIGLLLVAIVGVVVVAAAGDDDESGPSAELTGEIVEDATGRLPLTEPPASYTATYSVERFEAGEATATTEQYAMRRPFDAHITNLTGAPPGESTEWIATTNLGRFSYAPTDGKTEVGRTIPRSAPRDVRLDATLDDLVASGKFVPRERRRVLSRECQVYRTGQGVMSFQAVAPTETNYADACIDATGLLLEEVTVIGGILAQRTIVTQIDTDADLADDRFEITGEDTPLAEGGMELDDIDKTTLPVSGYWLLDTDGWEHAARYRVLQPGESDATDTTTTASTVPAPVESYADVYVKGVDYVVVQQGLKAAAPDPVEDFETVTAGALGSGQLQVSTAGSSVLTFPTAPADWFVTVTGSLSKAELTTLLASAKT